jgi:hypothetical protein
VTVTEDRPTMRCPRCGAEEPDFDGFAMLAHVKPGFSSGCGYCTHPSRDDGVCGICGDIEPDRPKPMSDAEIQHLVRVLEDIDKPFIHFTVPRDEFLRDTGAVFARSERELANYTVLSENGQPGAHVTNHMREHPLWDEDGPRLLATVLKWQARVKELEDHIIINECDDAIARSFGRNTYACTVADEIRSRRGQEWRGAQVDGTGRI